MPGTMPGGGTKKKTGSMPGWLSKLLTTDNEVQAEVEMREQVVQTEVVHRVKITEWKEKSTQCEDEEFVANGGPNYKAWRWP